MPRIPTHRRRRIPSGRVGGVPTPMDVADMGQGLETQGLGALGRGIGNLGRALFKIEEAEGISQASTAKGQADSEMRLLEERLKTNNDPETYQTELMKSLETINGFIPTNPIGAKSFGDYLERTIPAWESGVTVLKMRKQQALIEGAYISDRSKAIAKGDLEEANRLTVEARDKTGAITPQQAAKDLASAPALVVRSVVTSLLNDANRFSVAGESGKASIAIEQAQAILDTAKGLDADTERLLRSRIQTARTAAKNKQKSLTDIYVEQTHKTAVTDLVADIDNTTFADNFPNELRQYWQKKLDKRATTLEKEGRDIFNEYDPVLFSGLKQAIRETPDKVDYMDVVDSVGNGLTPTQAQELFELQDEMQRKDSPLAQSHIKRAHDRINDLQTAGLTVKGIEPPTPKSTPEETVRYMNIFDEMHEAIDKNTDLKPAEMRKYTEEMVRPVTEEAGKSFWRTLLSLQPTTYGFALGNAYMEREKLLRIRPVDRSNFEMKFKELYKVDPDTANKYWDRWEGEL